jgi:hypothetical protein
MVNQPRRWKLLAASAIGLLLLGQTAAAAPLDIQFAITGSGVFTFNGGIPFTVSDGSTMTLRFEASDEHTVLTGSASLRTLKLINTVGGFGSGFNMLSPVPGYANTSGGLVYHFVSGTAQFERLFSPLFTTGTAIATPFTVMQTATVQNISGGIAMLSANLNVFTKGADKLMMVTGTEIDRNLIPEPTSFATFMVGFLIVGASIARLRRHTVSSPKTTPHAE